MKFYDDIIYESHIARFQLLPKQDEQTKITPQLSKLELTGELKQIKEILNGRAGWLPSW